MKAGLTFVAVALGAFWIAAPASATTVDIGQVPSQPKKKKKKCKKHRKRAVSSKK